LAIQRGCKDTSFADPRVANRNVAWRSSNPYIATVDAYGLVTGIAPGTTTIIATSLADPSMTGSATVTVAR
jgi:uncharacterized protein YjdB